MKPFSPPALPVTSIQWESLIPLIGQANRSLAYYSGILYGISNPDVLLSPMTTREAVLSSKIEGTQATLGEVLKYEAGEEPAEESRHRDIQEIINYRSAMKSAEHELKSRPFTLNLLKHLHAVLLESVRGRNKGRGYFRTLQNWIGRAGCPIEEAQYIPPAPETLMSHLDNWEKYYHLERPDPLVQIAIIHAQFELIHPFLDGNGRIGRMLIPLFLYERKLISRPTFYISEYFERNRDAYVDRLQSLSGSPPDWNAWIEFFLAALHEQAQENANKVRKIIDLYQELKVRMIDLTHSQYAVPLLDRIFEQPVFQPVLLEKMEDMPSKPMIMAMTNRLRGARILKVLREGRGRRPQVLALAELINLCEGQEVL